MDKQAILNQLISHLETELAVAIEAATNARAASIDEQSIAETQYDTLAIEAGYLAEGQANRAKQLEIDLLTLKQLPLKPFTKHDAIELGALVQLASDEKQHRWYFIAPTGAGFNCVQDQWQITVITPQSPLGAQLIDAYLGDDVQFSTGHLRRNELISALC